MAQGLDIPPDMTVLGYVAECGAITTTMSMRDVDAWKNEGVRKAGDDGGVADAFALLDRFQFPRAR